MNTDQPQSSPTTCGDDKITAVAKAIIAFSRSRIKTPEEKYFWSDEEMIEMAVKKISELAPTPSPASGERDELLAALKAIEPHLKISGEPSFSLSIALSRADEMRKAADLIDSYEAAVRLVRKTLSSTTARGK